eukprot:4595613-Alexandrium_andersonii.AAC.1
MPSPYVKHWRAPRRPPSITHARPSAGTSGPCCAHAGCNAPVLASSADHWCWRALAGRPPFPR